MSITSENIDYIIKTGIHLYLKRDGFRKSSRTYRRLKGNCIQIVNVQGNRHNLTDQGSFTVNLAVYFPEAAKIHGLFRITDHPVESDCMIRERIGNIMPVRRDYWWKFYSSSDLNGISKEVVSAWLDYGKQWLEDKSSVEGALQFVLARNSPYLAAVLSLMIGDRQNAEQYLIEEINNTSHNPHFKFHLEEWGRSKGLIS